MPNYCAINKLFNSFQKEDLYNNELPYIIAEIGINHNGNLNLAK